MAEDKKDKIIAMQTELIRSMTERNLRNVGLDMWGGSPDNHAAEKRKADTISPNPAPLSDDKEKNSPPKEDIHALREELHGYIGLDAVKREVDSLINIASVYKMRRNENLPTADISLHMVFTGNPGTGKTMIARFMARVYHSLGLLSKGHLVETDRSGLVAGYVGQTAIKTKKLAESAVGGVLFIDEAYSLSSGGDNDFGIEAIDAILKFMEDNRDDIVVIVAGYPELMCDFISSNPGLESRFNRYIKFDDYTSDEMTEIFRMMCEKNFYTLKDQAEDKVRDLIEKCAAAPDFGNARGVRNIFENLLVAQANRLAESDNITREALMEILPEDVLAAEALIDRP